MIKESINLLGLTATDRVTGYKGVVISVYFDLSGCIQAGLVAKSVEGKRTVAEFFDVNRLEIDKEAPPVMDVPDFGEFPVVVVETEGANAIVADDPATYSHGPSEITEREHPSYG